MSWSCRTAKISSCQSLMELGLRLRRFRGGDFSAAQTAYHSATSRSVLRLRRDEACACLRHAQHHRLARTEQATVARSHLEPAHRLAVGAIDQRHRRVAGLRDVFTSPLSERYQDLEEAAALLRQ